MGGIDQSKNDSDPDSGAWSSAIGAVDAPALNRGFAGPGVTALRATGWLGAFSGGKTGADTPKARANCSSADSTGSNGGTRIAGCDRGCRTGFFVRRAIVRAAVERSASGASSAIPDTGNATTTASVTLRKGTKEKRTWHRIVQKLSAKPHALVDSPHITGWSMAVAFAAQ